MAHSNHLKPTSLEAQRFAHGFSQNDRKTVLLCIMRLEQKHGGATDHEIFTLLGMNPNTERPRRGELAAAGLIEDTGKKRQTPSGCRSIVWRTTGTQYWDDSFITKSSPRKNKAEKDVISAAYAYRNSPTAKHEDRLVKAALALVI